MELTKSNIFICKPDFRQYNKRRTSVEFRVMNVEYENEELLIACPSGACGGGLIVD